MKVIAANGSRNYATEEKTGQVQIKKLTPIKCATITSVAYPRF